MYMLTDSDDYFVCDNCGLRKLILEECVQVLQHPTSDDGWLFCNFDCLRIWNRKKK